MDTMLKVFPARLRIPLRAPLRYLPGGAPVRPAGRLVLAVLDRLVVWQGRVQDRDTLRGMSDARLRDLGLTRAEALREAGKAFWRV